VYELSSKHTEPKKRGGREDLIKRDLERGKVPIKDLLSNHPKSSVYYVLQKLKKQGEGQYVKVERDGKLEPAFQLIEKEAAIEEVKMLIQLISEGSSDIREEAARDLMAFASIHQTMPLECVDFLVSSWSQPKYADIQDKLLLALTRITINAKKNDLHTVVQKTKSIAVKVREIAKDIQASSELREEAWQFLIHTKDPRITDISYELLAREKEKKFVLNHAKEAIKRYAEVDRYKVRKRLYNILSGLEKETKVYERILNLLSATRYPNFKSIHN